MRFFFQRVFHTIVLKYVVNFVVQFLGQKHLSMFELTLHVILRILM